RTQAGHQAGGTAANQLLAGRHLGKQIACMAAAELFREADTENPGIAGLFVQRTGKLLRFLPFVDVRQDLALNEALDRVADQLMGVVKVVLKGGHGWRSIIVLKTITERLLGYQAAIAYALRATGRSVTHRVSSALPQRLRRLTYLPCVVAVPA